MRELLKAIQKVDVNISGEHENRLTLTRHTDRLSLRKVINKPFPGLGLKEIIGEEVLRGTSGCPDNFRAVPVGKYISSVVLCNMYQIQHA